MNERGPWLQRLCSATGAVRAHAGDAGGPKTIVKPSAGANPGAGPGGRQG